MATTEDLVEPVHHQTARPRSALFVESILIVASVLLGFAMNNLGERISDRRLARSAIDNFRREIQSNLDSLARVQPIHIQFANRLKAALDSTPRAPTAFESFVALMPPGGLNTTPMREAAWETALSTGALRLLDYDIAAQLSDTYLVQRSTLLPTVTLLSERFLDTRNFDPASRDAMLRVHQMLLVELSGQETYLMDKYRSALASLAKAEH